MRRAVGLLFAASLLMAAAPPPPLDARNEARDVIEIVVRSETAAYAHRAAPYRPCVELQIDQASVRGGGRRHPDNNIVFFWHGPDHDGQRQPVPVGDREAVNEAIRAALSSSTQVRWVTRIQAAWVAQPLDVCASGESPRLSFGSPVIVGDVAFVKVEFMCPTCGEANLAALRRTARGWTITAWRNLFMS
jgi:hypothetical protein